MVDLTTQQQIANTIVTNLQNSGVELSISEEDNTEIVVTSTRELTNSESDAISSYKKEILDEISGNITTSDTGTYPKRVFRAASIASDSGIVKLQSEIGSQGVATINGNTGAVEVVNTVCGETGDVYVVCSFNSNTGAVEGVNTVNESTGDILITINGSTGTGKTSEGVGVQQSILNIINFESVSSVNGETGAVTLTDLVGVNTWNGLSGDVDVTSSTIHVGGISSDGGATFGSNIIVHGGISANAGISTAGNLNVGGGTLQGISTFSGGTLEFSESGNIINNSGGISAAIVQGNSIIANHLISRLGVSSDTYIRAGGGISASGNLDVVGGISCASGATFGGTVKIEGFLRPTKDSSHGLGKQITIQGYSDNNQRLYLGYQTTEDYGVIGAYKEGTGTKSLYIVANGVGIGLTAPKQALDIAGDLNVTGGATFGDNVILLGGISGISANAGISTVGRVDAGGVIWAKSGISSDHQITTSRSIVGAFGRLHSTGISSNAGISTASGIQFSDGSIATSYTDTIGVYVTNGSRTLTTGTKGRRVIPYDCTVTEWVVTGSTSGSITWDINWGKTSAWPNALASVGFSGNGSSPQLGATASQSYVLIPTAWTKSGFSAGDVIQFEVDSVSTITDCELALKIKRMDGT